MYYIFVTVSIFGFYYMILINFKGFVPVAHTEEAKGP